MSTPRNLCSFIPCVLHVCILHICNRTGVRAGVEAVGQGSGIRWGGGGWWDLPRGEKRRGKQRKSKSEDQRTSWAPNEFRTWRTLTPGGRGGMVMSCLHFSATTGMVSSRRRGQGIYGGGGLTAPHGEWLTAQNMTLSMRVLGPRNSAYVVNLTYDRHTPIYIYITRNLD